MQADVLAQEPGSIELPACMDSWDALFGFVQAEAHRAWQGGPKEYGMILACEELLSNIIRHADAGGDRTVVIRINSRIERTQDRHFLKLQISDNGIPYDPHFESISTEPQEIPIEERPIGGLGLFLVKSSVDDVVYAYTQGRNTYTLASELPPLP